MALASSFTHLYSCAMTVALLKLSTQWNARFPVYGWSGLSLISDKSLHFHGGMRGSPVIG